MKISQVIGEFNKSTQRKAKLVSSSSKSIIVTMEGKSEAEIEKDMYKLRSHLQQSMEDSVLIQSIRKSGSMFRIRFSIEKTPADDILQVLKRYEEGTIPRSGEFED